MRFNVILHAATVATVAMVLSACAANMPFVRSHAAVQLPYAGQSYFLVPARADLEPAEFNRYAAVAGEALQARGLVPASTRQQAAMLVKLDFGVGRVVRRVQARDPLSRFRQHLRPINNAGLSTPIIPASNETWRQGQGSTESRHDFVEIGVVREADSARLFKGIATTRSTSAERRSMEPLVRAIFAKWRA